MGNMFNLFGAGGKSEGLYIWKLCEYIPEQTLVNPTFHIKATVSTQKATITSDDINFKAFGTLTDSNNFYQSREPEFCNFMNGFKNSNSSVNFAISTSTYSGQLELNYLNNSYWNAFTKMTPTDTGAELTASNLFKTTIDDTLQYTGTKTIAAKIGDIVGYVVSDKEDAYPDKGEQDGFYYEKIELSIDAFGCTKMETGSFTPSSSTSYKEITHSLGVIPKYAFIWTTGTSRASKVLDVWTNNGSYASIAETYSNNANTTTSYSSTAATSTTATLTASSSSSTYYFYSGQTYNYILLG